MSCKNCSDVTLLSGNDGNGIQTIVDNGDGTLTIFYTNGSTFTTPDFDGAAATIAAGTATGLPAGSSPTVTNSGTSSAAVFNFGIPAGANGTNGTDGANGHLYAITDRPNTGDFPYTLSIADMSGKVLRANSGAGNSDVVLNIPTSASVNIPIGSAVVIVNIGTGTGNIVFTPELGVTFLSTGTKLPAANGAGAAGASKMVTLIKTVTNEWIAFGDLV
jgi:hypothetical protein